MSASIPLSFVLVFATSVIGHHAGKGAQDEVVLRLPDREWGLRVAPENFEFGAPQTAQDGMAAWAAGDGTDLAMIIKMQLEEATGVEDDAGCLARAEGRLGLDSQEVHQVTRSHHAGMPTIEYEVRQHGSVRVDQRNLHAYRFHDGACAEFHLSLMDYRSEHRPEFDRVLSSIEFVEVEVEDVVSPSGAKP